MKSEEQWEFVDCTPEEGRVYQKGDVYKFVDRAIDAIDSLVEQIYTSTQHVYNIEKKLKKQGINRFINEARRGK